ncbi:MAG: nitrate/nitrite transporter NrtS [Woeseiaceae bacterium]
MSQEIHKSESWLQVATRQPVVARSLKVSMIVGTILVGINHGDALLGAGLSNEMMWKVPLTYMVPYAVSTYAAVDAILSQRI